MNNISVCLPNKDRVYGKKERIFRALRSIFGLKLIAVAITLGVCIPVLVILSSFFHPEPEIWQHIIDTLLTELFINTLLLSLGVTAGTLALGVGTAWLTAVYEFPGRKFFSWALMLPLAMPTYVLAFVFIGLFDFAGPVQSALRSLFPAATGWFPNIRSTGGVILVMSLALYPYVYLLARNAFKTQGKRAMEVARVLGNSQIKAFFKTTLPMARPWIANGLMLVLMETLADFGAVSIFNYDTFTTGIYKAWFGFFSLHAAAQLSSVLLLIVFLVIIVEQQMRAKMRFNPMGRSSGDTHAVRLHGWKKWWAAGVLSLILLAAFALPLAQLTVWSVQVMSIEMNRGYFGLLMRSILFSSTAALVKTGLGLLLAYIQRRSRDIPTHMMIRLSTMGYALPGTVLAVGIVITIGFVDRSLIWVMKIILGIDPPTMIQGTILTVMFAYAVRFLTAGFNSIASAMHRITPSLDEAAAILGVTGGQLLRKIHIPILKNGLLAAAMLVFVEVMKEMPITLMTRPFGWDTLAVKIFELTSEGEWQRAALPAMALVLAGLIPLMLLNKKSEQISP